MLWWYPTDHMGGMNGYPVSSASFDTTPCGVPALTVTTRGAGPSVWKTMPSTAGRSRSSELAQVESNSTPNAEPSARTPSTQGCVW